ncbi:hypothetical protein CEXT_548041 [Caerostris extrusa]|uniref:Uncharacterized protein n=1 Tax=Caerostris extrusa TaxID=172846 RepID=A0AAV4P0J3_CAEEX|nr:hypothetical protein CEXT_548041 [Caerostris extrusa]
MSKERSFEQNASWKNDSLLGVCFRLKRRVIAQSLLPQKHAVSIFPEIFVHGINESRAGKTAMEDFEIQDHTMILSSRVIRGRYLKERITGRAAANFRVLMQVIFFPALRIECIVISEWLLIWSCEIIS